MNIVLRDETLGDEAAIDGVITAAFLEAPHTSHTEQFIVQALRRAGALTLSIVAEREGRAVGYVAVSPVSIWDGTSGWCGLGPLAVHPDWQRLGIGAQLVQRALVDLRAKGASGCVVLGDPGFYRRFGFRAEPNLRLSGVPPEYFQAVAFRGVVPQGIVEYHEAFGAQG